MTSWAAIVASGQQGDEVDKVSEEELSAAKTLISNGVVSLAEEVDPSLLEHWQFGLVGRFKLKAQPLEFVRRALAFFFGRARSFEILPAPEGSFLIIMQSKDAMDWALSNGPWPVGGCILFLEPWCAGFDFSSEVRSLVPTWLYLPNLPKRLFSRAALIALASLAGRPLLLDSSSYNPANSLCARVKILCDLSSPLPDGASVEVKGFSLWQSFRFGMLPKSCSRCGMLGHSPTVCSLVAKPTPAANSSDIPLDRGRSKSRRRRRITRKHNLEPPVLPSQKVSSTPENELEAELVIEITGDVSPQQLTVPATPNESQLLSQGVVSAGAEATLKQSQPVQDVENQISSMAKIHRKDVPVEEDPEVLAKAPLNSKTLKHYAAAGNKIKEGASSSFSEEVFLDKVFLSGAKEGLKPVKKKGGRTQVSQ